MLTWLQIHVRRWFPIVLIAALYGATRQPRLSTEERSDLTRQFRFSRHPLTPVAGVAMTHIRRVHPDLQHLSGWISSVGAACALADLDADGLTNDICYVETRTNQVIVTPVPGTASRYASFVLDAAPLRYDPVTMAPMGCIPGDLNEDGHQDVLVYYWGRTPVAFLRDPAQAVAAATNGLTADHYIRQEIVAGEQRWYTNAATRADVDGDGHVDLVIGNYFQDGAHILDPEATDTQHMHHAMSRATNGGKNRLLLWAGHDHSGGPHVEYREAEDAFQSNWATGWTLGIAAADLDGNMLPELYFANDFGNDRLLHNRSEAGHPRFVELVGHKSLTTPSSKVLGRDSFKGMGVDFGDVDGDGQLDIYVSNIAEIFALEESHFLFLNTGNLDGMAKGEAPFVECSERLGVARSGWGWESRLADFNNDGQLEAIQATGFVRGERNRWPQLHEAAMGNDMFLRYPRNWHRVQAGDDLSGHNPNPFFVRAPDGRFYDVAPALGLDEPQVTRGIATADVDGDGDLDFMVANQWDESRFFRNDSPYPGAFLGLRLQLSLSDDESGRIEVIPGQPILATASRAVVGATAVVHRPDGRNLVAQVDGGNGHSGVRSPDLHFGLGRAVTEDELPVDLRWRDNHGQIRATTIRVRPGWHTVVLAGGKRSEKVAKKGTHGEVAAVADRKSTAHSAQIEESGK